MREKKLNTIFILNWIKKNFLKSFWNYFFFILFTKSFIFSTKLNFCLNLNDHSPYLNTQKSVLIKMFFIANLKWTLYIIRKLKSLFIYGIYTNKKINMKKKM